MLAKINKEWFLLGSHSLHETTNPICCSKAPFCTQDWCSFPICHCFSLWSLKPSWGRTKPFHLLSKAKWMHLGLPVTSDFQDCGFFWSWCSHSSPSFRASSTGHTLFTAGLLRSGWRQFTLFHPQWIYSSFTAYLQFFQIRQAKVVFTA